MTVEQLVTDTLAKYEQYAPDAVQVHREIGQRTRSPGRRAARSGLARTPRSRGRIISVTASAVALMVAFGVVVGLAVGHGDAGRQSGGSGSVFDPPSGLSTSSLAASQISYRVDQQLDLDAAGSVIPNSRNALVNRNWVSADGDIRSVRTGSQTGCQTFAYEAGFPGSNRAFFRSLPIDVTALTRVFRKNVQGSSSRDEAVFVAVGDTLRTADGFASPRLRAAMLGMLSRTPGVVVHEKAMDYLHRDAIRADFTDQRNRPGEIHSLYFDPTTFQLLEERFGSFGSPTYAGPSPAYTAHASDAATPTRLSGAAFVDVMRTERTLTTLPPLPAGCTKG